MKWRKFILVTLPVFLVALMLFLLLSANLNSLKAQQRKWTASSHDKTNFPLKGKHRTVACGECHKKGVLKGTPTDCEACHWYRKRDDRYALKLGLHCVECHTPFDWKKVISNSWHHGLSTGYQLLGAHTYLDCFACHKEGQLNPLPSQCVSCHLSDYNNTDHKQLGYSTACTDCHPANAISWDRASLDHNRYWPLKGAHKTIDCSECHSDGYNLPRDCFSCHQSDYKQARDPNHANAGFPTDCEQCHFASHLTWSQAVFNHKFPINSGKHRTLSCSDCHITTNYLNFSCITCHDHSRREMDKEHDDVGGYNYNSRACYTCHPQGRE